MRIKNIFINLLGAALLAAGSAGTAMAQWSTADFGGKLVTSDVFDGPTGNKVSFLTAPAGDAFVVWTRDSQALPGQEFDILAERLASSDGSKVWGSPLAVASNITEGTKGAYGTYMAGDSSGGFITLYSDDVSSNCYVVDYSSASALRWGPTQFNLDPAVSCDPKISKSGGYAFVSFSTSTDGQLEQSFVQAVNLTSGAKLFSGNGTAVYSGRNNGAPSPAGGGQANAGAIFVSNYPMLHAFRADTAGAVNWSVDYTTITAIADDLFVLEDGASGAYVVWRDSNTQDISAIRIDANGVLYPNWPFTINTNMYIASNYGGFDDRGAFYAVGTSSGVVVSWAEDVSGSADIHAALLKLDGTGVVWNNVADTLTPGGGAFLTLDHSNLTIAESSRAVALAYQYGNDTVQKALNAAVLALDGQTLVAARTVFSGLPTDTTQHDAFAVRSGADFIVGVMVSTSVYAQKIPVPASPPAGPIQRIWIGGGADLASEAGNWLPPGVPQPGDGILYDAFFNPNLNLIWDLGASVPLSSVTINGAIPSSTLIVSSPLVVTGDFILNSPNTTVYFNSSSGISIVNGQVTVDAGIFSVSASTLVAVGSITVNSGTFDLASALFMGNRVVVNSGATFSLRVADTLFNPEPPVLTSTSPASALKMTVDGTVVVSSCVLGTLWHKGIEFGAAASFSDFSNVLFQGPLPAGTTAIYFDGGTPTADFNNVNFADSNIYYNVNASLLSPGANINMIGSSGPKAGEAFENDPSGYVQWAAPGAGFTGDFSQAGGANFDGGDSDAGWATAFYGSSVYVVGYSSPSGALAVQYDLGGNVVSSAVSAGHYGTGVAVNANGVYLAAQGVGTGFVAVKYTADLTFVSSAALAGDSSARSLALDDTGNVYLAGSNWGEAGGNYDYKIAKFSPSLVFQSSAAFDAGGMDEGRGIAVDNGFVYVTGDSLVGGTTYFVTAKYDAATLAFVASAAYSGAAFTGAGHTTGEKLAVNPVTHDLYLSASSAYTKMLTVRYSQDLAELGYAEFTSTNYARGSDIKLDDSGNVYVTGPYNDAVPYLDEPSDYPVLLKYSPALVFLSSAASMQGFEPAALALDPATGNAYVTGAYFTGGTWTESQKDLRTVKFAPMTAQLPVVYVSSEDVSPAFYLAGQEAAALKLTPYTLSGEVSFDGLLASINPAGSYANIASVALYDDSDSDGSWNPQNDTLISSAPVTSAVHYFDFTGMGGVINTTQDALFITLTPAVAAVSSYVNVAVLSSNSFTTNGAMAQQAIYPIVSAPALVNYLAGITSLSAAPGANLGEIDLTWTYPQDITAGHYVLRYSTNPADLSDPNSTENQTVTDISGITAGALGSLYLTGIPSISDGPRIFPRYVAVWLYNGTSTSTASNLARNLYFPATSVSDQDATLLTRPDMYIQPESGTKFARGPAGTYSAFSFDSGANLLVLNTPDGASHYYHDPTAYLALKDLAADQDGNTYGLIQKAYDTHLVVKFGPDGSVLWTRTFVAASTETAKALAYGNNAVYEAVEYENGSNGQDFKLRKLSAADGTGSLEAAYDSSPGNGSYDEVNSLAFASDTSFPSGGHLYAAGASGQYPMNGRLHKFTDTGSVIAPSVTGAWPVQYYAPGGDSRALVVKEDPNGNLLAAGSEQRYDLNQGLNIWLNRYSPFGAQLGAARYNNNLTNADDVPTGLDLDSFGNTYVSGFTDMWPVNQGYNMLLAKFAPGGQFISARIYESGPYELGLAVQVSTDNYAHVAGYFGGVFGLYSMPLGSANAQFFTAAEGLYAGSADLMWNFTGSLPAGSTYYVQYSTDPAPAWNRTSAQVVVSTGPLFSGTVQSHRVGGLPTLRYPGDGTTGQETRGNLYKFKVWITSGGLTTELPEAQSFAKTPSAFDNTQYYGRERLSYMSGLSGHANAIAVDGPYVYQAFGGLADGASAGFGLRKYNTDQYLEWTKFFNHKLNRGYTVRNMTRDAAGNFYLVGSQGAVIFTPQYESVKNSWIAKLNSDGDLIWSYINDASGLNRLDELYDVAVEGSSLYVVGLTSTAANGMNLLARKYDISPSTYTALVWTYTEDGAGNGDDAGYGIAVGTGAVYLSGTVLNTDKDMIVRALDKTTGLAAGAPITVNSGNGDDEGFDIALTTTTPASVYLAGLAAAAGTSGEGANAALFKYTLAGAPVWERYFNGRDSLDDALYAVKLNGSGVIVAGYESTNSRGRDAIYRKFDHAGAEQWSRGFNFSNDGDDDVYSLSADASGRVYSAISLWGDNPGFYYFPEPSFGMAAEPYHVPGSVRLDWMSQYAVPSGSPFAIQYSTYDLGVAWSTAAAQVWYTEDSDIWEGMNVDHEVFGLHSGRDAQGMPTGVPYYFKVWFSTAAGVFTAVPGAASARASDGWAVENMVMYPNEAKLFVMNDGQQSAAAAGEKEFPGVTRDTSGNLYTVANMNWYGNGGFAVKKFSPALLPLWTKYYAPGEWFAVNANRLDVDAAGDLYITGYERAPGGSTGKDLFVLKLGENGVVWKSTYNFAGGDDTGYGVTVDASGYVYVSGSVDAGDGNIDILAAKFGPTGVLLSTVTYSGSGSGMEAGYGIAVNGSNVYVAGSSYEPGEGPSLWLGRFSAATLAAQGAPLKRSSDSVNGYEEAGYDVTVDRSGYVYVAGSLYGEDSYSLDAVVIKSSADLSSANWAGPALFSSQGGGDDAAYGLTIGAGSGGNVYVAGSTERYDINQDKNLWIRKYALDGSELLTQEFNSSALPGEAFNAGSNSDEGFDLVVASGIVSVSGRFNDYYGLYRYKQGNTLSVNPVLTVVVGSATASAPFPGVRVALIPFSATGGLDSTGIRIGTTNAQGVFSAQMPAGKQYFISVDRHNYNPNIKDQQMDPYGNFFVQLDADTTRQYVLTPRPENDPYHRLRVTVTSVTANDYIMAEVFFTRTGEKAAYGISQAPVGKSSMTFNITNVPPADAGVYTLGVTIPNRGIARSIVLDALFPQTSSYVISLSTSDGAVATTGGFDVGASTTPPSVEGVVKNARTRAPLEEVRVRMSNPPQNCSPGSPCMDYNVYETLTDVNGKYSFYNVVSTAAPYNLTAQKSGYKRAGNGVDMSVPNLPTVYREFQLEESTYSLRGVIRYRDVPVPNADVMVWGDYNWYGGSDSYRGGRGLDTDARTRTAADGSFVFSTATLNALPDGQLRMNVAFFGTWVDLNEGNVSSMTVDADDIRIVISSAGAKWNPNSPGNCAPGRVWKLLALNGVCQGSGDINFNIMPQGQNDYATLSGSVTFVTTYPVTALNPLVISSMSPVTVMAMQDCNGDCQNRSLGFAVLSGTYTVNSATYSITLSTGVTYFTRITSSEWGEVSSFDDRANFSSTATTSVIMNFTVTKAGSLKGVVKMPDGSNYKPAYSLPEAQRHSMNIEVRGQNVNVSEGWNVDDYGAFEFPNLAPGLYTVTMRPQGLGFHWAAPVMADVAVVAGKTTQVTLKLEDGLVVQPQIIGLPEISTPTWAYVIIPVESGTEMNQKKVTELFFGKDTFAFNYSTVTHTWDKKVMLTGQYDFYLMLGARYSPEEHDGEPTSFDQFGNFIGKVKGLAVQRSESSPNLGTDLQPIPVSILGSLGQESFEGTILGSRIYTDADLDKVFSNFDELFPVIPAVMVYDAAGDLRGYTAGLPTEEDFNAFWNALVTKDKDIVKAYFAAHSARFMVSGLPPGRYTVIFSNPNYPPIAKELDIPLASSYPFNFDEQSVRTGDIYGTVRSSATGAGLGDAVVYLKHRTMEKFTNTAADGSYSFDNLPQGIYRLEVTREGFVKTGQKTSLTGSLTGDDQSNLDFYMTPSQSNMTGKVYLSKFPAPLTKSGVKIVAYDETFNTEHPSDYLPKMEATTNDAGEYELAGVVPGHNYKVTAFFGSKLPATLDVSSETVTEGVTYLPDIVLREVPPQIKVKVRKSPDSANKVDVTIKSPKQLVSTPVCKVNPGSAYLPATAVSLALVPGPNNTYLGQFTVSRSQAFYNVYVKAGDGSNKMEKSVTYSPNNQAKTEQYIQDEAIKGGEVQMDKESEEYSGIELDAGGLAYSTFSASASGVSAFRTSADGDLVGGFFSALPSVRTVKTAKGDLSLTQAIQDLMASEVYNMELENASANKPFTLTLKYDKDKAAGNGDLRIYQYDEATGGWREVPGDYTVDPMLGVLSVGVASLTDAHAGVSGVNTPLGRKRFGMSAVVNGRYVPSAAATSQSGRFAVFTANPPTGTAAFASSLEVYNLPNPFNLKSKSVTLSADIGTSGITNPYPTNGTVIKYNLPAGKSGVLKFVIYNMAGEKVRTIDEGSRAGGQVYYSEWDGRNDANQACASGVYFMLTYLDGKKLGNKAHKMAIIK